MILSDYDIEERRKEFENKRDKTQPLTANNVNIVGHNQWYFFATYEGEKNTGICGLETRLLGMTPPRNQQDEDDEAFYVNLAVLTHVDGFYAEIPEVRVTSISLTDVAGNTRIGVCKRDDIDVVNDMMNAKFRDSGNRKLQLVVSNPPPQDTPAEPT